MTTDALKSAREALLTAIAACDAAGFVAPALGGCLDNLSKRIATEDRRAVPLAIGGAVEVHHYTGKRWSAAVMTVGAKRVRLADRTQYRLDNGGCVDGYSRIDEDDLHRINRDLVPRPKRERGGAK